MTSLSCAASVRHSGLALKLHPAQLARYTVFLSAPTIVASLLLTQFYPKRFRIHPYPYLSDAGLRDPERFILSGGMAISAALFLPLVAAIYLHYSHSLPSTQIDHPLSRHLPPLQNFLPRLSLLSGILLSLFLALFTSVPGFWIPHHVFAALFALSAGTWSVCVAVMSHVQGRRKPRLAYLCALVQLIVIVSFAMLWISLRLRIPFALIPNKDPRFVYMALLEYVGTTAFLTSIILAAQKVSGWHISLRLYRDRPSHDKTRPDSFTTIPL
ncbi:hypothetical protein BWQ96_01420 [Gracilariopsis chorda]|uniref:CWH43-like N-terminal domain-containing protein n=1 Tax=Gracilariopsis chorda TaxID=448386 RepID=A0A2V3J3A5_9FLOR|nr:hypothetical protein BWQ96_01420 [Gracilariopsis chorda]|eukprot:PXF48864.1 hypothetical protein BWQ96_01420 [Gracilariopsis chorda]